MSLPFKSRSDGPPVISKASLLSQGIIRPSIGTSRKIRVKLLVDRSSSMAGDKIRDALAGSADVATELARPENQGAFEIGLIAYNHEATIAVPFTPASSFALPPGLDARGATDFAAALTLAKTSLAPFAAPAADPQRPCLLFMTDGRHVASSDPLPVAREVRDMANIVCVALGADAELGFLTLLATDPSFVTRAKTGAELRSYFAAVAKTLSASRRAGRSIAAVPGLDPFASRRR